MTAESRDIARQLVAGSMFRWMPGMLSDTSGRVLDTSEFRPDRNGPTFPLVTWSDVVTVTSCGDSHDHFPTVAPCAALPDLDDPATLGCLLALVREAWGGTVWTQGALCYPTITHADMPPTRASGRIRWIVGGLHRDSSARVNGDGFGTEAEALVAALEGAPRQTRRASNPAGTW